MQKVKDWLRKVMDNIFVDDCNCIVCDKEIPKGSKYGLCDKCLQEFPFNTKHICLRCGRAVDNEAYYCLECQNHAKNFDIARSPLRYTGQVNKLLLNYKFYNKRYLFKHFSMMMIECYQANNLRCDVIIPVPLSQDRLKLRGYNQAELLATEIGRKLGIKVDNKSLIKCRDNARQSELSSKDRRENVVGAYKVLDKSEIKDKKVLIIDDVLTTGSTCSEVARILRSAGAVKLSVLTCASALEKVSVDQKVDIEFDEYIVF